MRFAAPFRVEEATQASEYAFGRVVFLHKRSLPSDLLLETAFTPSVYVLQRRTNGLAQRSDLSSQRRYTDSETEEQSLLATAKVKRFIDSDEQTLGLEFETSWQDDKEATQVDGGFTETGWGGRIDQRRTRWAAYGQWDWNPKGSWAVLGGLRHEEINTVLKTFGGLLRDENRSAQTSPSLSLVYRPIDAPSELYRWSLSHAYKPARAGDLLSAPRIASRFPVGQANTLDAP
ncbi:MAG: TonB-dependent receptor domain-containing protein, partial [Burkholderiaceae bacterium]